MSIKRTKRVKNRGTCKSGFKTTGGPLQKGTGLPMSILCLFSLYSIYYISFFSARFRSLLSARFWRFFVLFPPVSLYVLYYMILTKLPHFPSAEFGVPVLGTQARASHMAEANLVVSNTLDRPARRNIRRIARAILTISVCSQLLFIAL